MGRLRKIKGNFRDKKGSGAFGNQCVCLGIGNVYLVKPPSWDKRFGRYTEYLCPAPPSNSLERRGREQRYPAWESGI